MKKPLFFLFLISFALFSSLGYAREAPIELTYSLPQDNPDVIIEKRSPFELFAIAAEGLEGEKIKVVSVGLKNWDAVCENTIFVVELYQNEKKIIGGTESIGKFTGTTSLPLYNTYFPSQPVGTYGALHFLVCGDSYTIFDKNNGCEGFWTGTKEGLCTLYKQGEHRISNAEEIIFQVKGISCIPQTEICDGKDNDCDNLIDELDCTTPCTNDCESGDIKCKGDILQKCGKYDSDSCLEYPSDNSGTKCDYGCTSLGSGSATCKPKSTIVCGDEKCETGETLTSCPADCKEPSQIIEPELYKIYAPYEINWDNTPPAIGIGIKNPNNEKITRNVEIFYVAKGNSWYDTYLNVLQKASSLQSVLNPVPEIEESASCIPEDEPKQTVKVTLQPNQEITFWMNPNLPEKFLVGSDTFGGESNRNTNGDYLLYAGTGITCGEGHKSVIGKIVKLSQLTTIPKEICTGNMDEDQDGLVDWNDGDCGGDNIIKCGDGNCGSGETSTSCPKDCDIIRERNEGLSYSEIGDVTSGELFLQGCTSKNDCESGKCDSYSALIRKGILTENDVNDIFDETTGADYWKNVKTGAIGGAITGTSVCIIFGPIIPACTTTGTIVGAVGGFLTTAVIDGFENKNPASVGVCITEKEQIGEEFDFEKSSINPCVWGEKIAKGQGCLVGWTITIVGFIIILALLKGKS